jgi:hypothetical protein
MKEPSCSPPRWSLVRRSTGTADSARWNGVIVAKSAKRKAVVTVSQGSLRTVRAPNKFRHLCVGQRVAVKARMLTDGTYAAAAVRGQGRVSRVRFRGVVFRQDRCAGRLILSAGKSVFAARETGRATASATPAVDSFRLDYMKSETAAVEVKV